MLLAILNGIISNAKDKESGILAANERLRGYKKLAPHERDTALSHIQTVADMTWDK